MPFAHGHALSTQQQHTYQQTNEQTKDSEDTSTYTSTYTYLPCKMGGQPTKNDIAGDEAAIDQTRSQRGRIMVHTLESHFQILVLVPDHFHVRAFGCEGGEGCSR